MHFLKNFDKKSRFFGARSPSKLVYIGAKGAFRKILGSVGQKWLSEKVSKGGPFGSTGGRIPKGRRASAFPRPWAYPFWLFTMSYGMRESFCRTGQRGYFHRFTANSIFALFPLPVFFKICVLIAVLRELLFQVRRKGGIYVLGVFFIQTNFPKKNIC